MEKSKSKSKSSLENQRNWLELPCDVTLKIMMKFETLELLLTAQFVSKLLYDLCKEPSLWRNITILNLYQIPELSILYEKLLINAVDRSDGGLIHLNIEGFGSDDLFSYVASRSSQLKRLRLACCHNLTATAFVESLGKLSSLKELELTICARLVDKTIPIINMCSSLTTFKCNKLGTIHPSWACDEEALAIAGSMHELRHLQVVGNKMTNIGLTAILDGCPHLQFLDLRACCHLDLEGNLGKRLSEQIKDYRLPFASTDDYNYPSRIEGSDYGDTYESDGLSDMSEDSYYESDDYLE